VAEAHAQVQRLVSVVKRATVFEKCTTESSILLYDFFWTKRKLNANDIHKEIFPVHGGKCLSLEAVHKLVEKFSQERWKVADDARSSAEVAETTAKNF
jgi:hypothetical protein